MIAKCFCQGFAKLYERIVHLNNEKKASIQYNDKMTRFKLDCDTDYMLHSLDYISLKKPAPLCTSLTLLLLNSENSYSHHFTTAPIAAKTTITMNVAYYYQSAAYQL